MSIKRAVKFSMHYRGDGSSTEFTFLLAAAPIWFEPPLSGQQQQATFDLATTKPSDVKDVSCSAGIGITSADVQLLGTQLKVVFASAPAADQTGYLSGALIF